MVPDLDKKCYLLAEYILNYGDNAYLGSSVNVETLTDEIISVIDSFVAHAKDNYEPPEDPDAWSGGFADNH